MKQLKFICFLVKHKRVIRLVVGAAITVSIIYAVSKLDSSFLLKNPTLFGVFGTLLGAIIGGFFSLMGSVWVNENQHKALQNVKRKNVIYCPLYDELIDIQDNILNLNPYPNYVTFEKGPQTISPHPQFSAWNRIKSDTRFLEVPNVLLLQMERLDKSIREYLDIRPKANVESQKILNAELLKNGLEACRITNIGDVISKDILDEKYVDIYHHAMEMGSDKLIEDLLREKVNKKIYVKANENQIIIETREKYQSWLKVQAETIELLSLLIKRVLMKYEG